MLTEAELLAAVEANPADDAPRLAHADWLQHNGDPDRAELIRLQIRHARRPWDRAPEWPVRQLLQKHQNRWLAGRPTASGLTWDFVRGYPEGVTFSNYTAYNTTWKRTFAYPFRWVTFDSLRDFARLADSPGLARVRWLSLKLPGDDGLRAVLQSPHLAELEGLSVPSGYLSAASLELIASQPKLAGLKELSLLGGCRHGNAPPANAVADFVRSANLNNLRFLGLMNWQLSAEAVRPIWARDWPHLRTLQLSSNRFGAEGLRYLLRGERLPSLDCLSLGICEIGDDGAEALAWAVSLTRLTRLELIRNRIGDRGVTALAGAAHLASLERLNLATNGFSDAGVEALASSPHLSSVRSLELSDNMIGDRAMEALGRSTSLPNLAELTAETTTARPVLVGAVVARFRDGLPPLEPAPVAAVAAAPSHTIGQTDEDALVRAILADPYDELARAAYADWLEERGKPLPAQLLRLPAEEITARSQPIIDQLRPAISAAFASDGAGGATAQPVSGLIDVPMQMFAFIGKSFQSRAASLLREQHVAGIDLEGTTKDWTKVGNAPMLSHLRMLNLSRSDLRDEGAKALAGCAGMGNLCSLVLRGTRVREAGLSALCSADLPRLVRLELTQSYLYPATLHALAGGPSAGRLQLLDVSNGRIADLGLGILLQTREFASALVTLRVSGCYLYDRSVMALASSDHLDALRVLSLSYNGFTTAALNALASSALLRRLRRLELKLGRNDAIEGIRSVVRAAAEIPGLRLVLHQHLPEAERVAFRQLLGARLVLET
jgi:uncharacterized protein (TIGR02996 family)